MRPWVVWMICNGMRWCAMAVVLLCTPLYVLVSAWPGAKQGMRDMWREFNMVRNRDK